MQQTKEAKPGRQQEILGDIDPFSSIFNPIKVVKNLMGENGLIKLKGLFTSQGLPVTSPDVSDTTGIEKTTEDIEKSTKDTDKKGEGVKGLSSPTVPTGVLEKLANVLVNMETIFESMNAGGPDNIITYITTNQGVTHSSSTPPVNLASRESNTSNTPASFDHSQRTRQTK
jgi:hypothetical protein